MVLSLSLSLFSLQHFEATVFGFVGVLLSNGSKSFQHVCSYHFRKALWMLCFHIQGTHTLTHRLWSGTIIPRHSVLVLCYGPAGWHIHISFWLIIIPCDHSAPPWPLGPGPGLFSMLFVKRGPESEDAVLFSFFPWRLLQTLLSPLSFLVFSAPFTPPHPPTSLINGTQLK